MTAANTPPVLGLDLGASCSKAAWLDERTGNVLPLRLANGDTYMPAAVEVDAGHVISVGKAALTKASGGIIDVTRVARWIKREIGNQDYTHRGLSAIEISAAIFQAMKAEAERHFGHIVEEAVITAPAYFNTLEKRNTERAAELAGFHVRQFVPDPVAAAVSYFKGNHRDDRDFLRLLVYDFGGSEFNVAIVEKRDAVISVLGIDGDRSLGGVTFDKALAVWIMDQLAAQGYDLQLGDTDPRARLASAKLMHYAEGAKIELSYLGSGWLRDPYDTPRDTLICIPAGIADGAGYPVDIDLEITQVQFASLIRHHVEVSMQLCRKVAARALARYDEQLNALDAADRFFSHPPPLTFWRERNSLHEVLMVGGSTLVPLVQHRMREEWCSLAYSGLNPHLAGAFGAATIGAAENSNIGRASRFAPMKWMPQEPYS